MDFSSVVIVVRSSVQRTVVKVVLLTDELCGLYLHFFLLFIGLGDRETVFSERGGEKLHKKRVFKIIGKTFFCQLFSGFYGIISAPVTILIVEHKGDCGEHHRANIPGGSP